MAASQAEKPFITCHVLDTTTGKPAANIDVQLKLSQPTSTGSTPAWHAKTNDDGRVLAWTSSSGEPELNAIVAKLKQDLQGDDAMQWTLSFQTEPYFGKGKTFWPVVDLTFIAQKDEQHYHVPLLLGPWSYTTYRGS